MSKNEQISSIENERTGLAAKLLAEIFVAQIYASVLKHKRSKKALVSNLKQKYEQEDNNNL